MFDIPYTFVMACKNITETFSVLPPPMFSSKHRERNCFSFDGCCDTRRKYDRTTSIVHSWAQQGVRSAIYVSRECVKSLRLRRRSSLEVAQATIAFIRKVVVSAKYDNLEFDFFIREEFEKGVSENFWICWESMRRRWNDSFRRNQLSEMSSS